MPFEATAEDLWESDSVMCVTYTFPTPWRSCPSPTTYSDSTERYLKATWIEAVLLKQRKVK